MSNLLSISASSEQEIILKVAYDPQIIPQIKQIQYSKWDKDKKVWILRNDKHSIKKLEDIFGPNTIYQAFSNKYHEQTKERLLSQDLKESFV